MKLVLLCAIASASLLIFDSVSAVQHSGCSTGISSYDPQLPSLSTVLSQGCLSPGIVPVDTANSTDLAKDQSEIFSEVNLDKSEILSDLNTLPVIPTPTDTDIGTLYTRLADDKLPVDPEISSMMEKYKGRFICCSVPQFPNCDILLCGTLHVAKTSADMVQDTIQVLKPGYIVLELCEARVDNLCDEEVRNVTFADVIRESYKVRSLKVFGMGLLTWMQLKTAKALGSKLGEEQTVAAKVGMKQGSTVILGDRLYGVTFQRVSDKLKLFEKLKFAIVLMWEVLTMSFFKLKDYISKSENQEGFIQDEIARFAKHLPAFAKVLIEERDEYLSQTIFEIARVVGHGQGGLEGRGRIRVMAVVGAGHLAGIERCLAAGGVSDERIIEISSSSKHPYPGTWPGRSMLQVVNRSIFLPQPVPVVPQITQQQQNQNHSSEIPEVGPDAPVSMSGVGSDQAVVEQIDENVADIFVSEIITESVEIKIEENDVSMTENGGESTVVNEVVLDVEVEVVNEVEEHVDAIVQLLASLTPVVERAYAAVSAATEAASAMGVELSPELKTHLALLGEAVQDAKKAFTLTDAADKRAADSKEMERELNGLSNAVVRAEVAANAVIRAAEQLINDLKE